MRATVICLVVVGWASSVSADGPSARTDVFRRDNLIAWCIVPFDAQQRGPEARAAMLQRLGFKHFAYDYRAEHVPTFDAEIEALKKHGVSLDAWWFPRSLNDEARHILQVCKQHDVQPQLWITGGGEPTGSPEEQRTRVVQEAARIRPIAEAAAAQGMKVGLYNHGGWFGEPENQLAIIAELKLPNVGIVYNLHHGHDHLDRFAEVLPKIVPHLLALNLNGMAPDGDKQGQKILQLGQGPLDLELLRTIRDSGYRGPIGILGHTQDDAEARLSDNLDGLDWLLEQLDGKPAGPKPTPRTPVPGAKTSGNSTSGVPATGGGRLIAGRDEYRTPPLSVECRATLTGRDRYNILVACDTKQSAAHWELFTMPKTGLLTAYLPGYEPDHVRTTVDAADGKTHHIAMTYEADRVRLYFDGKLAADETLKSRGKEAVPGELAIGRLVEGAFAAAGKIEVVRLSRGVRTFDPPPASEMTADADTIGLWFLGDDQAAEVPDASSLKNPAKRAIAAAEGPKNRAPEPPPGAHLKPIDAKLKATLLDRSPHDVYLGVKVDESGHLFVGGREAVFLFEKLADGKFAKRRELLRFPPDSIIMGLEFRGDDLYVLTDNALYLVPRGRIARTDLQPQRILWGLPLDLHVSFHCLAWGPDGLLYLTHGDPLLQFGDWTRPDHWGHWTLYCGAENKPLPYTGQGAVLRMKPDGTDVEVVARGLRGPVGLAFDADGNLFTNDNDHESRADQYAPSRLLHVVDGIDFGWPRGWMASKSPQRFDLIEPVCDLGRGAPCDLTFYDKPLLADVCGDRLLMCRWDSYRVTAYRPEPFGATFVADEETIAVGDENCRPVGIATDAAGRLYVTALYMTGNQAAPDCWSDLIVIDRADGAPAAAPPKPTQRTPASPAEVKRGEPSPRDVYARQLIITDWAEHKSLDELRPFMQTKSPAHWCAAVAAIGRRLTMPDAHFVPPPELELFYPKGNSFFHRVQRFYGEARDVDLAELARVGSFTTAQLWATGERTAEQEALFAELVTLLDHHDEDVRWQAAYYLSLLKDERSESVVKRTQRENVLRRLGKSSQSTVDQAWIVGPFAEADKSNAAAALEQGMVDLSASYDGRKWRRDYINTVPTSTGTSYLYFGIVSGARQPAMLRVWNADPTDARQNQTRLDDPIVERNGRSWLVDLQPGSNDFLVRTLHANEMVVSLQAALPIECVLPERLDSAQLAERLRSASVGDASQPVPPTFAEVDWNGAAAAGDTTEGRRLFGTLGCAKCHAVAPDQKSTGAPSLFEAKRRFAVPHLVESVLLPSRQVAEPFRAQTFVTDDGRTLTALVTGESENFVDLLLPDATRKTLAKKQIEERSPTTLSPMPQGLVKTPDELRHLLAYLLSDRPLPP